MKHHRKALDQLIQAAEEAVEHTERNNLLRQEVIDAENELAKAVQAKNSSYQVQKAGLNAEAHIASPITKTVQEVLNDLKKYAVRMIHPPDIYMFCKRFISALHDLLCNEVLKKGYNAEFSTIDQLYETALMIEEASHYNHGM